jgi:hypothetical protein
MRRSINANFKAVLANLDIVQKALRLGANPQKLPFGFIHIEQRGVIAIDQKGGGRDLAQTRLYVYLDRDSQVVHLITLGDKTSQKADVKTASDYVEGLTSQKGQSNHGREEIEERHGDGEEPGGESSIRE